MQTQNKLVVPTHTVAPSPVNRQGYSIGLGSNQLAATQAKKSEGSKSSVNKSTLVLFCLSAIFMIAMFSSGSNDQSRIRRETPALLKDYSTYLARNQGALGLDLNQRRREVKQQLQTLAALEELGDRQKVRRELLELMLLDGDARSPLYQRCIRWLKNFPE